MKKFITDEIRNLLNRVYRGEISFSEMVEMINERVSEAEDTPEELKSGDLAIFWDDAKEFAIICMYVEYMHGRHFDCGECGWKNAIKFESKKQFKRFIKGEI